MLMATCTAWSVRWSSSVRLGACAGGRTGCEGDSGGGRLLEAAQLAGSLVLQRRAGWARWFRAQWRLGFCGESSGRCTCGGQEQQGSGWQSCVPHGTGTGTQQLARSASRQSQLRVTVG